MAHLLLIDDDLALTPEQGRKAFPAPAHTVALAGTGAAGLEHVRARPPDVILLDLRLPDQSGLDVYRPRCSASSKSRPSSGSAGTRRSGPTCG
jgi:two-component system nitrogen regulation response regulator GlnG